MQPIIDFAWNNAGAIFAALFAISEILAQIDYFKSNSVFQFCFAWLKNKEGK